MLFDELLPWQVAEALRALGHRASWVGNDADGAPARGSSDEVVLTHARSTNQIILTSNLDMILLCEEQEESVVWIDPYGRHFTRDETALLAFREAADWESRLAAATGPVCLRALRTRTDTLTLEAAGDLVRRRMRNIEARKRRKARRKPLGPLLEEDPAGSP